VRVCERVCVLVCVCERESVCGCLPLALSLSFVLSCSFCLTLSFSLSLCVHVCVFSLFLCVHVCACARACVHESACACVFEFMCVWRKTCNIDSNMFCIMFLFSSAHNERKRTRTQRKHMYNAK